ncbi:hypothetical protein [Paenarthrobacter nitroguajacolicus]|uniref:hypothetical protein n=1 Tax=Paenarthrobacter nitroguajacolicus TaxID=211146 RepID=UPI004053BACC
MGRDLVLYPKGADKAELVTFITSFDNVQKTSNHLWDWPVGTVHYFWFDETDYRSTAGVEITIYPVRDDERSIDSGNWAMHVRNTYSATWHDVEMLNRILRSGRKRFGGDILGDYGKNRYAPLWEDESTPISRGLAWVYNMSHRNISAILHALPNELDLSQVEDAKLTSLLRSVDPSRVTYNGLVPFLISIMEFYFRNIFIILLKYDLDARGRIEELDFELSESEAPIEQTIASIVTFQNLRNTKRAFKKWLNIDVQNALDGHEDNWQETLWHRLGDLIKYRHDIIHRMSVNTSFSREEFIERAQLVEESLNVLLGAIAQKYHLDLEDIQS